MEAIINISGVIGEDFTIKDLIVALEQNKDASSYRFIIDSVGGYVDEGFAIARYIESLDKPTSVYPVMVYSIANILFFAADTRISNPEAEFMLHMAWIGPTGGNKEQLRQMAEQLEKIDEQIKSYISQRTGLESSVLDALMSKDTFISNDEAESIGFYNQKEMFAFAAMAKESDVLKFKKMAEEKNELKEKRGILAQLGKILGVNEERAKNLDLILDDASTISVDADDTNELEGASTSADDGTYRLEDGRQLTVSSGVVTSVEEASTEEAEGMEDDEMKKENEELKARISELEAKLAEKTEESELEAANYKAKYDELEAAMVENIKIAKAIQSHREKFPDHPVFNQEKQNIASREAEKPQTASLSAELMKRIREKTKK